MPGAKGGVWTNLEDEILKASVSKYGLNQWARVSSLLARKNPKQCKARWQQWLDPSIRKTEWSKDEDEKLLHLAKLMPTQWRTIAPIVGRTATQCLERYQRLLNEAEARENAELGFTGPAGGESAPPTANSIRRLRPGEQDPDPESKPAKPDTVDMDEDEKEMLSEARARLANTQGKKAKRKARERQLEESRRMVNLQKRRELKYAGINIKITTRKKGQMDYNADIPFEKKPAEGFYDTREEQERNERIKAAFDPRKQHLSSKRKVDGAGDVETGDERKRRKDDKNPSQSASFSAAAQAAKVQQMREEEQNKRRRPLVLSAPQVSDSELEDIVKLGLSSNKAFQYGMMENGGNAALIRTPRVSRDEDRIINEIRNARALTDTESSLLGGENTPLYEGKSRQSMVTINPMATPLRRSGGEWIDGGATPRDSLRLNRESGLNTPGMSRQDIKNREAWKKQILSDKFARLPEPKTVEWEVEQPAVEPDRDEPGKGTETAEVVFAKPQYNWVTQVVKRGLPRPSKLDVAELRRKAVRVEDERERMIVKEAMELIIIDAHGVSEGRCREVFSEEELMRARTEIALELCNDEATKLTDYLGSEEASIIAGKGTQIELDQTIIRLKNLREMIIKLAGTNAILEKVLSRNVAGYMARSRTFGDNIRSAYESFMRESHAAWSSWANNVLKQA